MMTRNLFILFLAALIWIPGCASHPAIQPHLAEEGKTEMGFSLSLENVIPVIWYRRGLNKNTDVGLRIGIPLSGTGVDINRVLFRNDRKWDILNLAWSFNPNSNFDVTYMKFSRAKKENRGILPVSWMGFRIMIIPNGVLRQQDTEGLYSASTRAGLLYGRQIGKKWGIEFGYYHDFQAMPFSKIFSFDWNPKSPKVINEYGDTYVNFPPTNNGLPSEYSRLIGLSFQVYMYLGKKQ